LAVGADAAGDHQALHAGLAQGLQALGGQDIDGGGLEGGGDVGLGAVAFLVLQVEYGGLQAAEAELQVATVQHGARQGKPVRVAAFRQFRHGRAARVAQAEELRGLVEGFAGGIVQGFAEQCVATDAIDAHDLGVAA
jgi:hypothetical protein